MQPNPEDVQRIILTALAEDIGHGDATCAAIIPDDTEARFQFTAREPLVVCGLSVVAQVFHTLSPMVDVQWRLDDGAHAQAGEELASVIGPVPVILAGERVALNLLQRMCGIATETARYVEAVAGTGATILDTRKTMPGLRVLDKYAVRAGGGRNHRMRLDDAILIKDNHIAVAGSVREAFARAQANAPATLSIEVECDTLEQAREALDAGATRLLLDNMTHEQLREAVALAKGKAQCEASGNVSLETVRAIAETGVDYISVGRITHSVRNIDIGLDAA